jgi:hypothetical protein
MKISNKTISMVGFVSSVAGLSGFLFGGFLFYIFPLPLLCSVLLFKNKPAKKDLVTGITCLLIAGILVFYIVVSKR